MNVTLTIDLPTGDADSIVRAPTQANGASYLSNGGKTMEPLSLAFNAAVMTIANRVNPLGWDIGDDAPTNLAALQDHIARTGRIKVDGRNSDHTIFADPEHNYAFRAWHDWTHWIIRAEFTLDGELAVAHRQCEDLCRVYGHSTRTRQWCAYIMAEVYGQAVYYAETGRFPTDQVAFDIAWIAGDDYVR